MELVSRLNIRRKFSSLLRGFMARNTLAAELGWQAAKRSQRPMADASGWRLKPARDLHSLFRFLRLRNRTEYNRAATQLRGCNFCTGITAGSSQPPLIASYSLLSF